MNRRHFLVGSAVLSAQRTAYPQPPLGVGMIGTGNRGSFVLQGVVSQPGVKVNALCDLKPDRLDKGATIAARDKPATLKDYRELLARKDIDAVFIETPCDLHVEMVIAALKAGKHV
jgi:myo-inositol 2-dehydrogenase / D-chiro-inositol 1-dehydrogenase